MTSELNNNVNLNVDYQQKCMQLLNIIMEDLGKIENCQNPEAVEDLCSKIYRIIVEDYLFQKWKHPEFKDVHGKKCELLEIEKDHYKEHFQAEKQKNQHLTLLLKYKDEKYGKLREFLCSDCDVQAEAIQKLDRTAYGEEVYGDEKLKTVPCSKCLNRSLPQNGNQSISNTSLDSGRISQPLEEVPGVQISPIPQPKSAILDGSKKGNTSPYFTAEKSITVNNAVNPVTQSKTGGVALPILPAKTTPTVQNKNPSADMAPSRIVSSKKVETTLFDGPKQKAPRPPSKDKSGPPVKPHVLPHLPTELPSNMIPVLTNMIPLNNKGSVSNHNASVTVSADNTVSSISGSTAPPTTINLTTMQVDKIHKPKQNFPNKRPAPARAFRRGSSSTVTNTNTDSTNVAPAGNPKPTPVIPPKTSQPVASFENLPQPVETLNKSLSADDSDENLSSVKKRKKVRRRPVKPHQLLNQSDDESEQSSIGDLMAASDEDCV